MKYCARSSTRPTLNGEESLRDRVTMQHWIDSLQQEMDALIAYEGGHATTSI